LPQRKKRRDKLMGRTIVRILRRRKVTISVVMVALTLGVVSSAFAANGGNFILGVLSNSATAVTRLTMTGTVNGSVLQLIQQSTGTGASGLGITVPAGKAPITVNSTAGKATNLNADKIDSLDSTALQRRVSGTCAAGQSISSIAAAGTVSCETDDDSGAALRSELGTTDAGGPNEASDPVSYSKLKDIPADVVNRNADTLDGKTASEFADSTHSHSGEQIDSGTVEADRIEDGPGSNLNADQLDGLNSTDLTVGMATASAQGNNPTTTVDFLAPPAQVSVAAGQVVHVTSNKAFGSTAPGGGQDLRLWICSRPASAPAGTLPTTQGQGVFDMDLAQNQRTVMGLSWVIVNLPADTYQVGLCGSSTSPASWNSNEFGYTTAMIVKPSVGTAASLAQQSQQSESSRSSEQNK
jgi:hypothetical protein